MAAQLIAFRSLCVPMKSFFEPLVLVTLEPRGEQTELTLHHSGVPDDEIERQHKEGWTWVLSMLAECFAPSLS
jgi:Activator of Hsp90 ATPase homolog 1-like protein